MRQESTIYVYYDGEQVAEPLLIGKLTGVRVELFSFEFENSWIQNKSMRSFDPDLQLFRGRQYVPQGKDNFGLFLDSTPDSWGRMLLLILRQRALLRK